MCWRSSLFCRNKSFIRIARLASECFESVDLPWILAFTYLCHDTLSFIWILTVLCNLQHCSGFLASFDVLSSWNVYNYSDTCSNLELPDYLNIYKHFSNCDDFIVYTAIDTCGYLIISNSSNVYDRLMNCYHCSFCDHLFVHNRLIIHDHPNTHKRLTSHNLPGIIITLYISIP